MKNIDLKHILLNKDDDGIELFFAENAELFFNDKKQDIIQSSCVDGDVCIIDAKKLYEWLKEYYDQK